MSYKKLKKTFIKIADINNSIAVLNWDQETYMPKNGAEKRAQQIATLSGIAHEMATSKKLGKLLKILKKDKKLSDVEQKNVKLALKDFKTAQKFSTNFVMKESKAISVAFQAWIKARKEDNFEIYVPALTEIVKIQREKAEILGYKNHPYNALMHEFEPGATVKDIDALFADVKKNLSPFIEKIFRKKKPNNQFMFQHFPQQKQWDFGMDVLKQLGFDFEGGRQDLSEHPFTTDFGQQDVRLTTRVEENNL